MQDVFVFSNQLTLWLGPSPSVSFAFLWHIFAVIKKYFTAHGKARLNYAKSSSIKYLFRPVQYD